MITSLTPLAWYAVVSGIGACVQTGLESTLGGIEEDMRVCFSVPGQIAWDDCTCGQLALSVGDTYLSTQFPAPATAQPQDKCGPPFWAAPITISVLRCAPGYDHNQNPPTCEALATASMILESDRVALLQSVACCLKAMYDAHTIAAYTIGVIATVGPDGGCVGVNMNITVGIQNCSCGT